MVINEKITKKSNICNINKGKNPLTILPVCDTITMIENIIPKYHEF